MTLGVKIQELRRKRGMSQDVLAEKLDVSRQAVSKWERDEAIPETEKIIRLAQEFQVSIDYLLLSKEEENPPESVATPPRSAEPSAGQQVLRGVRRHGYKAGYGMMIWGAVLCVLAVLIAVLISGFASGSFRLLGSFTDSAQSMVGSMGFGGGLFDDYNIMVDQQLGQMENMWTGTARMITLLVSGSMGFVGLALIVGGVVVTVKGKKVAQAVK